MTRLPVLRPKELLAALRRGGFDVVRVHGGHYQLLNSRTKRRVTIPHHNRDLTRKTLASILDQAGLSPEELEKLL
jgi:predicted RNA binding protein YcfA (HicA-like mRNA interferase family)